MAGYDRYDRYMIGMIEYTTNPFTQWSIILPALHLSDIKEIYWSVCASGVAWSSRDWRVGGSIQAYTCQSVLGQDAKPQTV